MKEYTNAKEGIDIIYYYQHDNLTDATSETACYYCIVNKEFKKTTDPSDKVYASKII